MTTALNLCTECDIHLTRRENGLCYRCNDKRDQDSLLNTLAPVSPVRFPLPPETRLPCEGKTELFFGQGRVSTEARRLCASCPALLWCLEWATENDEEGIWAGLTRKERRARKAKLTQATVVLVA